MAQFKFNTISKTDIENSEGGKQMIHPIDYDGPHHLLITGCPGSGKTTVSIMRAERLNMAKKQIIVITFQNLLKVSLINTASKELASKLFTFYRWYSSKFGYLNPHDDETMMIERMINWSGVDEIIIDEGQDFESRIYRALIQKCKKLTVGADNAQRVHENGLTANQIHSELKKHGNVQEVPLQYNYRNTFEIYNFARYFMPDHERANNQLAIDRIRKGNDSKSLPTIFLVSDSTSCLAQLQILLSDAGDRNIAVLLYHTKEVDFYYDRINELGIKCSKSYNNSHVGLEIENVLVTTFKSAKGLEFQVVIMPNMETAMDQHFQTREHYYIACTRAKENLFLIVQGDRLPHYFSAFDINSYRLIKPAAAPKKVVVAPESIDDLPF